MQAKQYYDNHLANFYSWMVGDLESKSAEFKSFLVQNQIAPTRAKVAIDLGAGNGIQSIAKLLHELESNERSEGIHIIQADIRDVLAFKALQPELMICCGDTLTHLDDKHEIENLIKACESILTTDGRLILTFRDYSKELNDEQRFIPVKSTDDRILTCILEYGISKVKVTDLLYEKTDGQWNHKVSSYEKVRISSGDIRNFIEATGMIITFDESISRMHTMIGKKI